MAEASLRTTTALLLGLAACAPPDPDDLPAEEMVARAVFETTPVAMTGRVLDEGGAPVAGAVVRVGERVTGTDDAGRFALGDLARHNRLVHVGADGFRDAVATARLHVPVGVDRVDLDDVVLAAEDPSVVRFLFGGDTMFGRRFLDPDGDAPWDVVPPPDPSAAIATDDPGPGAVAAVAHVVPLFRTADFPVLNLESPVTARPRTPHRDKPYVFFTLPGSLDALTSLGVGYVSLGNNHLYDYLEGGVADTIHHLDAAGVAHSGAGPDATRAWMPYRRTLSGHRYSFVSATSIDGRRFDVPYVATDDKGGAANLTDGARFAAVLSGERQADRHPVALLHSGDEYTVAPTDVVRERMAQAVDHGAALVVGHHPHVAQGFDVDRGVLLVHSLGNFAMDQDRLETLLSVAVEVDLRGSERVSASAWPLYLEDYGPRLATGELADHLLRRIAEHSDVGVAVHGGRAHVVEAAPVDREHTVVVDVPDDGVAVLDLRPHLQPGESLHTAEADADLRVGRDLLLFGTFEDDDVDDDATELARWDVSGTASFPCLTGARRGAVGLCLARSWIHLTDAVVPFRHRVRVWGDAVDRPDKDLTLVGWARGTGAGRTWIHVVHHGSEGDRIFGEEDVGIGEGDFAWRSFAADLHMPPDDPFVVGDPTGQPRALRLYVRQSPPRTGDGLVAFDDLAVVSWEEPVTGPLSTPHARDFLRIEAAPGPVEVTLGLRRHAP